MSFLYWITGLAGAGKTAVACELTPMIKAAGRCAVMLDGDVLRQALGKVDVHAPNERIKLAATYARLAKAITDQGVDVVMPTMALFPEIWSWNRANIKGYREIYLKVPLDVLTSRDKSGLYSRALKGGVKHVVGINCDFNEPTHPDLTVVNDGQKTPHEVARRIFAFFNQKGPAIVG